VTYVGLAEVLMFDLDQADADIAASTHVVPVNASAIRAIVDFDNALFLPRAGSGSVMQARRGRRCSRRHPFDGIDIFTSQRALCAAK